MPTHFSCVLHQVHIAFASCEPVSQNASRYTKRDAQEGQGRILCQPRTNDRGKLSCHAISNMFLVFCVFKIGQVKPSSRRFRLRMNRSLRKRIRKQASVIGHQPRGRGKVRRRGDIWGGTEGCGHGGDETTCALVRLHFRFKQMLERSKGAFCVNR